MEKSTFFKVVWILPPTAFATFVWCAATAGWAAIKTSLVRRTAFILRWAVEVFATNSSKLEKPLLNFRIIPHERLRISQSCILSSTRVFAYPCLLFASACVPLCVCPVSECVAVVVRGPHAQRKRKFCLARVLPLASANLHTLVPRFPPRID